jgi:RimJ/RimL family protein N-acetyltransferase
MLMLEGKRVRLRALERGDAERGHRWINDGQVRELLHGMRYPVSVEDEERWLEGATSSSFSRVALAIETREGAHIGNAELRGVSAEDRRGELGILIGEKEYWGKGYGTDATVTVLRFAFEVMNLHRVWLTTGDNNPRAIACYRKCGFREEGRLRQDRYLGGRYSDTIVMGVLREEFEAAHPSGGAGEVADE